MAAAVGGGAVVGGVVAEDAAQAPNAKAPMAVPRLAQVERIMVAGSC
jgi:hypothetical protein